MDLDAELYEWDKLNYDEWQAHPSWMVDAIDEWGRNIDVKFIRKYWNVSRERLSTSLNREMTWTDTGSWSGYLNPPAHSYPEMRSKFDTWGSYTTETLQTTSESPSKTQTDFT